jgi:hypothetical protein
MSRTKDSTKTYYLHTLDGMPAFFDGDQIVFTVPGGWHRNQQKLCTSLRQIRRQHEDSKRWREAQGFEEHTEHDYARVVVPSVEESS